MSIIDENEVDVVSLQKELERLREENQDLRQENTSLKAKEDLYKLCSQDIDDLYLVLYGEDTKENEHDKMMRIINAFSTKKSKILLKFLI